VTNDHVELGGDDPTNDMHESGGVQGATQPRQGQRRTPSMTTVVANNQCHQPETTDCVYASFLLLSHVVIMRNCVDVATITAQLGQQWEDKASQARIARDCSSGVPTLPIGQTIGVRDIYRNASYINFVERVDNLRTLVATVCRIEVVGFIFVVDKYLAGLKCSARNSGHIKARQRRTLRVPRRYCWQ